MILDRSPIAITGQLLVTEATSNPPSGRTPPEVSHRRVTGRSLAFLSLCIYLIGLGADATIVIGNQFGFVTGVGPAIALIPITFGCLGVSIILAIASCFTYPRALFMLLLHGLTIAVVIRISQ